jgi:two-component system phosphate regulon sensor histidine kinase PhoR
VERLRALTSRFFWHLYLSYVVLVLIAAIPGAILLSRHLGTSFKSDAIKSLEEKVALFVPLGRDLIEQDSPAERSGRLAALADAAGFRMTLASADGTVVADTASASGGAGNILDRPEILAVLARQRSLVEDAGESFVYVAAGIWEGNAIRGFVRGGTSLASIRKKQAEISAQAILSLWIGIVVALLVGLHLGKRMTDPVLETRQVAEAIQSGDYSRRVHLIPNNEIGILGDTLNRLCVELIERIATISHDQARLSAMLSGMVEGVLAVDDDGKILFCNAAASKILGVADPKNRKIEEFDGVIDVLHLITKARDGNTAAFGEVFLPGISRERVLEIQATPFAAGDVKGVVLVLHDVTRVRRLETIRQDFVANVSHELKTPLTSVRGYVETLLCGALTDEENNVRFLKKIDVNVDRLIRIVVDLLSLARIEAQQDDMPVVPVEWAPIVRERVRERDELVQSKNLNVMVDRIEGSQTVLADPDGLDQIISNLLDNAIRYTPDGGTISIRLSRTEVSARLEIEDTGIGIPAKDLENIFQRFYRVDKARSRALGSTGLGLSIVKHLVQAMNGDIKVRSEVGEGTCFTVVFPLA